MPIYYKNQLIAGGRGPAGPDGTPIGTVISYLGVSPPADYLACDGAEYAAAEYPALAAFFETEFGAKNHFGGDGETTFAVPDMRNLFLRGYHGGAQEALSGDVGARQEATEIPTVIGKGTPYLATNREFLVSPGNVDSWKGDSYRATGANATLYTEAYSPLYTARPVNMAVLYCIKAVKPGAGGVVDGLPSGSILMWSSTVEEIPPGYALCDGENGTPDLRGRFVLGSSEDRSLGETGGEEAHQLTVEEMPAHSHKENIGSQSVEYPWTSVSNGSIAGRFLESKATNTGSVFIGTAEAGNDQPHNNMPPYYALCFIMKL